MQRKAILIDSSNAVVGKPLPGAAQDMKNWRNFLQSNVGGLWEEHEIADIGSCPTWETILQEINTYCTSDGEPYFLFVTFSGHGAFDKLKNKDVVSLNHNQVIAVDDIVSTVSNVTKNSVIMVDACRDEREYVFPTPINDFTQQPDWDTILEGMGRKTLKKILLESDVHEVELQFPRTEDPVLSGSYASFVMEFLSKRLNNSGPVLIQSCSVGEFANEQGSGLFSNALIQFAKSWWWTHHKVPEFLTIDEWFNGACRLLQKEISNINDKLGIMEKQTPCILPLNSKHPVLVNVQNKEQKRLM